MSDRDEHAPPQRSGRTVMTRREEVPRRDDDVAAARRRAQGLGAGRPPRRSPLAQSLHNFVRRYGWRAYALPVLVVVTIVALATTGNGSTPKHTAATSTKPKTATQASPAAPTASGDIALKSDAPGVGAQDTAISADALPAGAAYTAKGDGTYRVLKGTSPVVGTGTVHRYDIEVENGITGIDLTQFEDLVVSTLSDKRSWAGHGGVALQRVDSGSVDFHVTLTSSLTIRKLCGYTIPIETSCFAEAGSVAGLSVNRVALNDARWVRGDAAYIGDLTAYRQEMINHEDGHALGHEHAHECLADGLAPAMMQQTIGLRSAASGTMCQANPWPYPPGATDAPGAEQPDTPQNSEFDIKGD